MAGRSVLVVGCGPIGLLTMIWVQKAGAACVIGADPLARRRAAALALGARAALDPSGEDWQQKMIDATGSAEADVTIDAVGSAAAFNLAVASTGPGGTVVAIGGWRPVPLDLDRLMHLELRVQGSFGFVAPEFEESCALLEQGGFNPDHVITDILPLSEGPAVFADLVAGRRPESIKIVLTPNPDLG